jgi:hypothetical protein
MNTATIEPRKFGINWPTALGLIAALVLETGCGNSKGKYAGKLKVEASPQLQQLGVAVTDWRYSDSDKTFGVQVSASKDFGPPNYIDLRVVGQGTYSSPVPVKLKAGEKTWLDFGGSVAFGNPFENIADNTTITLELH